MSDRDKKNQAEEAAQTAQATASNLRQNVFTTQGNDAIRQHLAQQPQALDTLRSPFDGALQAAMGTDGKGPEMMSEQQALNRVCEMLRMLQASADAHPSLLDENVPLADKCDYMLEYLVLNTDEATLEALGQHPFNELLANRVLTTEAIGRVKGGITEVQDLGAFGPILWQMCQETIQRDTNLSVTMKGKAGKAKERFARAMSPMIEELMIGGDIAG